MMSTMNWILRTSLWVLVSCGLGALAWSHEPAVLGSTALISVVISLLFGNGGRS